MDKITPELHAIFCSHFEGQTKEDIEDLKIEQRSQDIQITEFRWNEYDTTTIKFAKGLIVSNVLGLVFLYLGIAFFYAILIANQMDDFKSSFQLFVFSDIVLLGEKIIFFIAIINKKNILKLCPLLNLLSLLFKFIASGLVVYSIPSEIILSSIFIFFQIPHNIFIQIIFNRWKHIPDLEWKKQLVIVKEHAPTEL